jgi:hypothetical protein
MGDDDHVPCLDLSERDVILMTEGDHAGRLATVVLEDGLEEIHLLDTGARLPWPGDGRFVKRVARRSA